MTLHNAYLIVLTGLFVAVFAIQIYSLARHAQTCAAPSAKKFGGPTGRGQWLWALVPIAIVAGVDFALIDLTSLRSASAAKTIAVAAAPAQQAAGR